MLNIIASLYANIDNIFFIESSNEKLYKFLTALSHLILLDCRLQFILATDADLNQNIPSPSQFM